MKNKRDDKQRTTVEYHALYDLCSVDNNRQEMITLVEETASVTNVTSLCSNLKKK